MTIYNENLRNDNRQRYYTIVDSEGNYIQFINYKNELDNKLWNSEKKAIELFGQTALGVCLLENFRSIPIAEKLENEIIEIPVIENTESVIEPVETLTNESVSESETSTLTSKKRKGNKKSDTFIEEFIDEFNEININ